MTFVISTRTLSFPGQNSYRHKRLSEVSQNLEILVALDITDGVYWVFFVAIGCRNVRTDSLNSILAARYITRTSSSTFYCISWLISSTTNVSFEKSCSYRLHEICLVLTKQRWRDHKSLTSLFEIFTRYSLRIKKHCSGNWAIENNNALAGMFCPMEEQPVDEHTIHNKPYKSDRHMCAGFAFVFGSFWYCQKVHLSGFPCSFSSQRVSDLTRDSPSDQVMSLVVWLERTFCIFSDMQPSDRTDRFFAFVY